MKPFLPIQIDDLPPSRSSTRHKEAHRTPEAGLGPFEQVLRNLTTYQPLTPGEPTGATLSAEVLAHLVRVVSIQLTESLFSALGGEDAETEWAMGQERGVAFTQLLTPLRSTFPKSSHPSSIPEPPDDKRHSGIHPIDPILTEASQRYDVEPALIEAVIRAESNFDPNATSSKGAMGLMQLMPETAKDLGVKEPYNPRENIMAGTRYLKGLLVRYGGNIPLSLAAYNWGMGNVERNPGKLPEETRTYIGRVNTYYRDATA